MTRFHLLRWHHPFKQRQLHRSETKIPLRLVLTIPFVLLTVGTTGLVGYLCIRNGQQAVADLAQQLMTESGERTNLYLSNYLKTPQLVNRLNVNAVRLGQIDITDLDSLKRHFVQQIQTFDSVSRIHFSNPQGGYISVGNDERGLSAATTDNFVKGTLRVDTIDQQGNRQKSLLERANYDSRQRPFYQRAVEVGQPVWTPVYVYVPASRGLGVSASYPLYDETRQLQGVLSSDLTLAAINQFLTKLQIGTKGTVFIIDRSGDMIASSTTEKPFNRANSSEPERLKAIDSQDQSIRSGTQHLLAQFGNLNQINTPTQLQFVLEGTRQFLQVTPFKDEFGLDWLIVVMVPETNFMGQINANTRTTILFSVAALLGSLALGIWLSRAIDRPIRRLGQASLALANGAWDQSMQQNSAIAELQVLNVSFNRMAGELQQSFDRVKVALQESKEKFTQVFRTCPDPIGIVTLEGCYVEVNDAFVELFGYSREEVIGYKAAEIGHWVNLEERERYLELVQTGQSVRNLELMFRQKSGKLLTVLFSADSIELQGQVYVVGIAKDISDRKQLELALECSEARLNDMLNSVVASISSFRLFPDRHWEYQYWSEGCEMVFGYRAEEFLAEPSLWISRVLPEDLEQGRVVKLDQLMTEHPTTVEGEYRFRHKDGRLRWISYRIRSRPLKDSSEWMGTVFDVDITALKQAELELLRQKELRETIYNESADALFLVDPETLLIFDCNRRAVELFEADSNLDLIGIEGRSLQRFPFTEAEIEQIVATMHQKGSWSQEIEYVTRTGNLFWGNLVAKPVQIANQSVYLVGVTDISERKQAEEALRQNEARFQQLADASPSIIYTVEEYPGRPVRFEYLSPAFEEIHEIPVAEAMQDAMVAFDAFHPDDRAGHQQAVSRAFETMQPFKHEWRIVTPSGKIKWIQGDSRPERREDGTLVWHGVVSDISERKQAEEALRQSEARFQRLVAATPGAIYTFVKRLDQSFGFEYISPAIEEINELTVEQTLNDPPHSLIHPDDQAGYEAAVDRSAMTLEAFSHEFRIITPSGQIKWLQASSRPERRENGEIAWYGIVLDVSDRKFAEESLRQSENRLKNLASAAPVNIYSLVQHPDGSIEFEYVNRVVEEFHEVSLEKFLADPAGIMMGQMHPDDRQGYIANLTRSTETLGRFQYEWRIITPSGKLKWLQAQSQPERRENGDICWHGVVLDISDRKQTEEALRQSEERNQAILSAIPDLMTLVSAAGIYLGSIRSNALVDLVPAETNPVGKHLTEILPAEIAARQLRLIERALATREVQTVEQQIWIDDHWQYEELRAVACGEDAALIMIRDITDRKRIEEALRQSEQLFRGAFETSAFGISIRSPEGKYLRVNQALCQILGYTESELLQMSYRDITLPEDQAIDPANTTQKLLVGEISYYHLEKRFIHKDGHIVWGLVSISLVRDLQQQPLYFVAQVQDITDRKRAEAALQQSEARFQKIAAASPAQIYILVCKPDASDLWFEYISSGVREIQELEPEQVLQDAMMTYRQVHPDDRALYNQVTYRSFKTLEPFSHEWRIITPSGKLKWVQANSRPEQRENGDIVWYGVLLDVTKRKLAEESLRHSEAALRRAQQVAHIGSWEVDVQAEQVTWSEESFHIFGWDMAQPEPNLSQFYALIYPDDRTALQQAVARAIANGDSYKMEFRIIRPDGSIRHVEARGEAVRNEQGQVVQLLGTNLDITERHQAEAALRQSEATKNQILKAIPDLIIWMSADGTCLDFIDGGSVTNLYVKSEAIGKNLYDLLLPDLSQARRNAVQQALRTGEVQVYEQHFLVQDKIQHEEVRVIGVGEDRILVIVRDITDRKRAEAALLDSETRFRSAFHDAPIGMALIGMDDRWIKVNPMLCDMLGFSESELLSTTASSLVHPEDTDKLQQCIQQVFENRNAQVELRYCCHQGHLSWGLMSLSLVRDAQDQPLYYVAQIQDITERQAIDRMKNEFISIVSHELRTPLTAIRGFLGLLDTGIYDNKPDKTKHMIGQALTNSDRLVRLVNDILDLERLTSGKVQLVMEICDAADLMQRAAAGVQSIADQAAVTVDIIDTTAQVWADPDTIIQTLTNLLSNAIKFSPPQSMITLSTQVQTDSVRFVVADQGRGIPADKLDLIFGRFQQVDVSDSRQKGGTGLGLAICQSIVQQHGGNIWAESKLGEGSTFYFTLPLPGGKEHD